MPSSSHDHHVPPGGSVDGGLALLLLRVFVVPPVGVAVAAVGPRLPGGRTVVKPGTPTSSVGRAAAAGATGVAAVLGPGPPVRVQVGSVHHLLVLFAGIFRAA